jgi:hypothetical protein
MRYDERLIGITPSPKNLRESRARLSAMFKRRFEDRATERKQQRPIVLAEAGVMRGLAKDDRSVAAAIKRARRQAASEAKRKLPPPKPVKVVGRARLGSIALTLVPPFWPWTWSATTGSSGTASVSANGNAGTMSFLAYTGDNGKTASTATALGYYFRPLADNGVMFVMANPAVSYYLNTWTVFDSAHAGGFIGLYVGQYTLQGQFLGAVVDQQINLASVSGGNQGSNSAYPLWAWTPVDSAHYYDVWVWAGCDAEADGWSVFWGSAALSYGSVTVPSISIYAY